MSSWFFTIPPAMMNASARSCSDFLNAGSVVSISSMPRSWNAFDSVLPEPRLPKWSTVLMSL
ncbi:Uncharacterised protein [Mycobacteroides abscessus subsp. abscessus]|nr:Uncharacterised protein [Mycobacteroides abscessus subsp. abscessus]